LAGIHPGDAPAFIVMQVLGAGAATLLFRWLVPALPREADAVILPHAEVSVGPTGEEEA
jgi:glycerol uptake facilitator-like aquaporin